jgi:hypothetical protein
MIFSRIAEVIVKSKTGFYFRGQHNKPFNKDSDEGYLGSGMFFVSPDINGAFSNIRMDRPSGVTGNTNGFREITVFDIPYDKIYDVEDDPDGLVSSYNDVSIDRVHPSDRDAIRDQGYWGMTQGKGEMGLADYGEVIVLKPIEPIKRIQTKNGKFSNEDIDTLAEYGLKEEFVEFERALESSNVTEEIANAIAENPSLLKKTYSSVERDRLDKKGFLKDEDFFRKTMSRRIYQNLQLNVSKEEFVRIMNELGLQHEGDKKLGFDKFDLVEWD